MSRRKIYRRDEGQALVLVALAFVLLVGMLGLALDGANAFGQRRLVSNATDAAAIAGTRELIARLNRSDGSAHIYDTIESFLTSRNDLRGAAVTWRAYYVDRLSPEGSLGELTPTSGRPPSGSDGVRLEVVISFPTYFMGVFGQRTLSVSGRSVAVYGPLGTALGQDMAPMALSVTGLEILKREGTVRLDLKGTIADNLPWVLIDPLNPDAGSVQEGLPDDVITAADIKHVSFAEVAVAPDTGDDCLSATQVDSLTYWWCKGSPNKLRINRELPSNGPDFDILNPAIEWRKDNRNVLVLPVYADSVRVVAGEDQYFYELVNFVAVEIRRFNDDEGILRVRHLPNYATAGALIGDGSGVETGVWAINLTR
jgi:hypothetical protein